MDPGYGPVWVFCEDSSSSVTGNPFIKVTIHYSTRTVHSQSVSQSVNFLVGQSIYLVTKYHLAKISPNMGVTGL